MQPKTERGRRVGKDPGGRQAEQTCCCISNRFKSLIKIIFSIAGWLREKSFVAHSLKNPRRASTKSSGFFSHFCVVRSPQEVLDLPVIYLTGQTSYWQWGQSAAVWGRGFCIASLWKFVTYFGISQKKKTCFVFFFQKTQLLFFLKMPRRPCKIAATAVMMLICTNLPVTSCLFTEGSYSDQLNQEKMWNCLTV